MTQQFYLGHIPNRNMFIHTLKDLCKNESSSTIYNSQKWKNNPNATTKRMNK